MIKREFTISVLYPKGGKHVFTCVKDHIINEKEQYKGIGLHGFGYKLFEEEENGGTKERLYVYPYLNHIIQLWPGDWVKKMSRMNEAVGMKNHLTVAGGNKCLVCPFRRQELWKYNIFVLLVVTYGKKGHKLWS